MSRETDPRRRLRRANPVPPAEPPPSDSPQARALLERIVRTPHAPETRRDSHPRAKWWILVPIALLALAATGYGLFRHVRQPLVISCYQRADLQANRAILPASAQPIAACSTLWRPGGQFNPSGTTPTPPPLESCVLPSGALGVFPGSPGVDTCAALGLAHPTTDPSDLKQHQDLVALQDVIAKRFLNACLGQDEATTFVQQQLKARGFSDWRVIVRRPFTTREPCASAAYDLAHATVTLIPVANPATP